VPYHVRPRNYRKAIMIGGLVIILSKKMVLIVCKKKRNWPRQDITLCEKKCELKNECKEYQEKIKEIADGNTNSDSKI
jgi:hypothetical protein